MSLVLPLALPTALMSRIAGKGQSTREIDMAGRHCIGIDLGTRKSGVCSIVDKSIHHLKTALTASLISTLTSLAKQVGTPSIVVVDVPIAAVEGSGFRLVDRVFMRGKFNNNHVGIQPNNPDLLAMGSVLESLREWCAGCGIHYSNEFPGPRDGVLRETMPNVAFGMTANPTDLLATKAKLRFRFGRGKNIAPVIVAFECLNGKVVEFFRPIQDAPRSWDALEKKIGKVKGEQSDDLIAALVCGTLAWWACNTEEVGYVREDRGHYLLPPRKAMENEWLDELTVILQGDHFRDVKTNLAGP